MCKNDTKSKDKLFYNFYNKYYDRIFYMVKESLSDYGINEIVNCTKEIFSLFYNEYNLTDGSLNEENILPSLYKTTYYIIQNYKSNRHYSTMDIYNIGDKIKFYRKKINKSQLDLSKTIGIRASYLSEIEKSTKIPSVDVFIRIVKSLNVQPTALLVSDKCEYNITSININEKYYELTATQKDFIQDYIIDLAEKLKILVGGNTSNEIINDYMECIGESIKQMRKNNNIEIESIVSKVKISKKYYLSIERGQSLPKLNTLVQLAKALHTNLDYLLINCFGFYKKEINKVNNNNVFCFLTDRDCRLILETTNFIIHNMDIIKQ